jgi:hypothetical protein
MDMDTKRAKKRQKPNRYSTRHNQEEVLLIGDAAYHVSDQASSSLHGQGFIDNPTTSISERERQATFRDHRNTAHQVSYHGTGLENVGSMNVGGDVNIGGTSNSTIPLSIQY